jgi:hypothetical protein
MNLALPVNAPSPFREVSSILTAEMQIGSPRPIRYDFRRTKGPRLAVDSKRTFTSRAGSDAG